MTSFVIKPEGQYSRKYLIGWAGGKILFSIIFPFCLGLFSNALCPNLEGTAAVGLLKARRFQVASSFRSLRSRPQELKSGLQQLECCSHVGPGGEQTGWGRIPMTLSLGVFVFNRANSARLEIFAKANNTALNQEFCIDSSQVGPPGTANSTC